ncbi:hypothetical protein ACHAXN_009723 [Cyclotella atomus]
MPLESSLPTNELDSNDKQKRPSSSPIGILHKVHVIFSLISSTSFTLSSIVAVLLSPLLEGDEIQPKLLQIALGYLFLLRPLLSTLSVCIQSSKEKTHERVISSAFLLAIICNQFPKWASCAVASCTVLVFGLASRQLTQKNTPAHSGKNGVVTSTNRPCQGNQNYLQRKWSRLSLKERAGIATLAVVLSLLLENFLIWVVSATYAPGIYDSPTPLQDNGRLVFESLAIRLFNVEKAWAARRKLQAIRDMLNVQWAIVTALGASFVCLELQVGNATGGSRGRSLAGLALRALMTLATARLIRTVSFVLTVLPSQVPDCYRRHFPMPPDNWKEWLLVGFLPNSRGGCNDLILSGHATVLTTLGCGCTSVANNAKFSVAVWTLVAVDFAIESYQGLHYSVDMWLGCIVTSLLWQLTKRLEVPGDMEKSRINRAVRGRIESQVPLDPQTIALYATPAFLGFVIMTFVPEAIVNYFLVGYAIWAGMIMAKWGFTNFSQHILLCLLCMYGHFCVESSGS